MPSSKDYIKILTSWTEAAVKHLYSPVDKPNFLSYGTGYDNWGVQTHQKAFSAFAVVATDPWVKKTIGSQQEELLECALKMLRFNLESHKTGNYTCLDGKKWGRTWISMLGIERMMHGIDAISSKMSQEDFDSLKRVMLYEANYLVDEVEVKAGRTTNNCPESNIWSGTYLYRTAMMYPQADRREEYLEKGTCFLVNGISLAADSLNSEVINGRPVATWFVGDNFFDSFALNHHGYLNVGYMYICLSNIAMLYFAYRLKNLPIPKVLLRHVSELWQLTKLCTFPDGRLCRIGGDTRIRYCYCQDYALPSWLMMYDICGDVSCKTFEENWFKIVKQEVDFNGNASFLSARCSDLEKISPVYYTRLEADRAATFSMAAYWKRLLEIMPIKEQCTKEPFSTETWHDSYHGAILLRGTNRISSWCWKSAEPPQGLCLPSDRSDMAEWRNNCAGQVIGQGRQNNQTAIRYKEYLFKGGFSTVGTTELSSLGFFEGQTDEIMGTNNIAFTILPDDVTAIVMQKCVSSPRRIYFNEVKGFFYNMPNDIFNGSVRRYSSACGSFETIGGNNGREEIIDTKSLWLNVDGCLGFIGVYGAESFFICRPPKRQAGLKLGQYEKKVISTGLWIDEVCFPFIKGPFSADANSVVFDIGCVILTGTDSKTTSSYHETGKARQIPTGQYKDVKAMIVKSADGKDYLQIVNFGVETAFLKIPFKNCQMAVSMIGKPVADIKKDVIFVSVEPEDIELLQIL